MYMWALGRRQVKSSKEEENSKQKHFFYFHSIIKSLCDLIVRTNYHAAQFRRKMPTRMQPKIHLPDRWTRTWIRRCICQLNVAAELPSLVWDTSFNREKKRNSVFSHFAYFLVETQINRSQWSSEIEEDEMHVWRNGLYERRQNPTGWHMPRMHLRWTSQTYARLGHIHTAMPEKAVRIGREWWGARLLE